MLGDAALISHLIDIWTFEEINLPLFHSASSGAGADRAGHTEECGVGIVSFPAHPRNSAAQTKELLRILLCRCIIRDRTPRLNPHGVSELHNLLRVFLTLQPVSTRGAMLRQILLNSTHTPDFDLVLMTQSSTHAPSSLNASHGGSVSVAALLRPTAGRGGLREGELHKPDLITYIVMCLLLFLLVLLIVFFINCQLRNSFFASMPYDRSLREARTSYK